LKSKILPKYISGNEADEVLVEGMRNGNEKAFEILYERHASPLFQFFLLKIGNREKAEDFLQNLFITLIEKSDSYNSEKRFLAWFYSIAHNMCKNYYRDNQRLTAKKEGYKQHQTSSSFEYNVDHLDYSFFSEQLNKSLASLNSDEQTSFILRFKYQFSIKEISEVLKCKEGTTKSRIFYTLKKLSSQLKQFNPYTT
jgi:RNA polymerase sigma-70 factor (ECF subfamily)